MSSISAASRTKFGIVSCGVRKNTRSAYPVAEGSLAMSAKSGAAGFPAGSFGTTEWHSEHHCLANARPVRTSAFVSPNPKIAAEAMIARKAGARVKSVHQQQRQRHRRNQGASGAAE